MKFALSTLLSGILFGIGLTISGMTQPQKVISFLDLFGDWDPTLAFVMGGAIGVHFFAYRIKGGMTKPKFSDQFYVPANQDVDKALLIGAALFGVGWGLGGYCPGPGIVSLVSLAPEAITFVVAMTVGMFLHEYTLNRKKEA